MATDCMLPSPLNRHMLPVPSPSPSACAFLTQNWMFVSLHGLLWLAWKKEKKRECDKQCMGTEIPAKVAFSFCHCEHVGTGIPLRMAKMSWCCQKLRGGARSIMDVWFVVSMKRHDRPYLRHCKLLPGIRV